MEEKLEKAEKMSRLTIQLEPENPTYLDTYAWILFKSGKLNEAKKYIEKAIEFGYNIFQMRASESIISDH